MSSAKQGSVLFWGCSFLQGSCVSALHPLQAASRALLHCPAPMGVPMSLPRSEVPPLHTWGCSLPGSTSSRVPAVQGGTSSNPSSSGLKAVPPNPAGGHLPAQRLLQPFLLPLHALAMQAQAEHRAP